MGEYCFALGVGSVYFHSPDYIYVTIPIYWVPNYTSNNLSSGAMKLSSGLNNPF